MQTQPPESDNIKLDEVVALLGEDANICIQFDLLDTFFLPLIVHGLLFLAVSTTDCL